MGDELPGPPRKNGEQARSSKVASLRDATSRCWLCGPRPRSALGALHARQYNQRGRQGYPTRADAGL